MDENIRVTPGSETHTITLPAVPLPFGEMVRISPGKGPVIVEGAEGGPIRLEVGEGAVFEQERRDDGTKDGTRVWVRKKACD